MKPRKKQKAEKVEKCLVPICQNYSGTNQLGLYFFQVPSTGHKVYEKWCQLFELSRNRTEKICSAHFRRGDFIENVRRKIKDNAVPSVELGTSPVQCKKSKFGGMCCVDGCFTKARGDLLKFPTKQRVLNAWKRVLEIDDSVATGTLHVCNRHFKDSDYRKIISLYLRPNAVPSRKIKTYGPKEVRVVNKERILAKSNRCCCVKGCRSRAVPGVKLHQFPDKKSDRDRYKQWIKNLKLNRLPAKNTRVCSKHFEKTCYLQATGGNYLKKNSLPTLCLPDQSCTSEPDLDFSAEEAECASEAEDDATSDEDDDADSALDEMVIDADMCTVSIEEGEEAEPDEDPLADETVSSYLSRYNFQAEQE